MNVNWHRPPYVTGGCKPYQTVPACIAEDTMRALLMSLVKTAATSPKSELLALSITSSIVLNLRISWTGPKICNKIMYVKMKSFKSWLLSKCSGNPRKGVEGVAIVRMPEIPPPWRSACHQWHWRTPWAQWRSPSFPVLCLHTPAWRPQPHHSGWAPGSCCIASYQSAGEITWWLSEGLPWKQKHAHSHEPPSVWFSSPNVTALSQIIWNWYYLLNFEWWKKWNFFFFYGCT